MFKNDGMFGKKDDTPRSEPRSANFLSNSSARAGTQPQAPSRPEPDRAVAHVDEQAGSKLIVGPNVKMKGVEVTDCDTVIVEGHIEAMLDSRLIQVAEGGVFTGNASMDVAEIWGRFEGELTVRKQLIIHASGRVNGYIRYGKIKVDEGGEISGEISTLAAAPGAENTATTPEFKAIKSAAAISKQSSKPGAST
jgi:cytoskeletal protein CcmA (bactofilin family)